MIAAYFDDSGTSPNNDVAAVGGYLGTKYQWDQFVTHWPRLLNDYGVEQMHRTDLENLRGEFTVEKGWSPSRRNEFVRKAQRLIKRYTYVAVGSAVIKKDFQEVMPEPVRKFFGGAYGWCVHECHIAASKWCDKAKHREPIDWVFEAGTEGSGQIGFYFQKCSEIPWVSEVLRVKTNGWAFRNKNTIPLQAADVVAYEIFKQVQNQIVEKGKRNVRLSALDLFREKDKPYMKYWHRDRLLRWLNEPGLQPFIAMITRYMTTRK